MNIIEIVKQDYQNFPDNQTYSIYAEEVYFEDPLNKFRGVKRYQKMIGFLGSFFQDIVLELHEITQNGQEIRTDWTLNLTPHLPWKPRLSIPGWSELQLNQDNLIIAHCDRWKLHPVQVLFQIFSAKKKDTQ
ncbi:MAG TPA: DUF2358 domain-containing protein [Xenococcaceae cyanobacterium]